MVVRSTRGRGRRVLVGDALKCTGCCRFESEVHRVLQVRECTGFRIELRVKPGVGRQHAVTSIRPQAHFWRDGSKVPFRKFVLCFCSSAATDF
eukprot:1284409-Rhodomonas_salina.2